MAGGALLATAPPAQANDDLEAMLSGQSVLKGKKLKRAIEKADAHPLGSEQNPVRAEQPQGQRAYLAALRCADGGQPMFQRRGSMGIGVFGNIVDAYELQCEGDEPAATVVYMDMYHRGFVETRPLPGFTIAER